MALQGNTQGRRQFLRCGACALGAAVLTGCRDSGSETKPAPVPISLGPAESFPPGVTVRTVERLAIVRDSAGFGALSLRCTHQECLVSYTSTSTPIECPCHGAVFSPEGELISGPAPTDLPWFEVKVDGQGTLHVLIGSPVARGWRYPWNSAGGSAPALSTNSPSSVVSDDTTCKAVTALKRVGGEKGLDAPGPAIGIGE
ncbi:MAG: hypothetical protein RL417_754 [Pseudomonadota bacterium]|jgi:nitrite reductase/ring-hydroxylating ferredoxin subunit